MHFVNTIFYPLSKIGGAQCLNHWYCVIFISEYAAWCIFKGSGYQRAPSTPFSEIQAPRRFPKGRQSSDYLNTSSCLITCHYHTEVQIQFWISPITAIYYFSSFSPYLHILTWVLYVILLRISCSADLILYILVWCCLWRITYSSTTICRSTYQ